MPYRPCVPTPPVPPVMLMLRSLIGMQPRPVTMLRLKLMINRYQLTQMLFLSTGMICLPTLSGAMMMLGLLLFSLRVSYLSLHLSLWGLGTVAAMWSYLLFIKVTLLWMSTSRVLPSGTSLTNSGLLFVVLAVAARL